MTTEFTPGPFKAFNPNSWSGGPCPVDPADIVEVNLHNGRRLKGPAGQFGWVLDYTPYGAGWSIASYRIVQPNNPS